jgi:hypothetical protein
VQFDLVRISQTEIADYLVGGSDQVEQTTLEHGNASQDEISLPRIQNRTRIIHIEEMYGFSAPKSPPHRKENAAEWA